MSYSVILERIICSKDWVEFLTKIQSITGGRNIPLPANVGKGAYRALMDLPEEINSINCIQFTNNAKNLIDIEFINLSDDRTQCTVVSRHFNVPDDQLVEHLERTLEVTE